VKNSLLIFAAFGRSSLQPPGPSLCWVWGTDLVSNRLEISIIVFIYKDWEILTLELKLILWHIVCPTQNSKMILKSIKDKLIGCLYSSCFSSAFTVVGVSRGFSSVPRRLEIWLLLMLIRFGQSSPYKFVTC